MTSITGATPHCDPLQGEYYNPGIMAYISESTVTIVRPSRSGTKRSGESRHRRYRESDEHGEHETERPRRSTTVRHVVREGEMLRTRSQRVTREHHEPSRRHSTLSTSKRASAVSPDIRRDRRPETITVRRSSGGAVRRSKAHLDSAEIPVVHRYDA